MNPIEKVAPGVHSGSSTSKGTSTEESTLIFISLGKRQRFYPRNLSELIVQDAGLTNEDVGSIRSFDNYSFVQVASSKADGIIAALDGKVYRGRKISVSLAKKREEKQS